MIKRIISVFLVAVLFSFNAIVFSSDYSDHWAYEEVSYLAQKGIMTGDEGGMRLDSPVKRAEFAKMVNKNFNLTQKSNNVFSDINPEQWFYDDILIAFGHGYLKGDGIYANPEKYISRAEAAVMLSRLVNRSGFNANYTFADDALIPLWAKDAVNTMVELSVMTGYADGSFKPSNTLTRAEAAALLVRIEDYNIFEANKETNIKDFNKPGAITSSSSAGGGGSSGGGGASSIILAPVITVLDADKTLHYISETTGNYTIRIIRKTDNLNTEKIIVSSETSKNISMELNELMSIDKKPVEIFSVSIMVSTLSGASAYSAPVEFTVNNPVTVIPEINVVQSFSADSEESIILSWKKDETVSEYAIELDFNDGSGFTGPIAYSENGNDLSYALSEEQINKIVPGAKIKINAKKADESIIQADEVVRELPLPMYGGKTGDYNKIINERHFKNIKFNSSDKFIIENDIVLTNYTPFIFSGILKGESGSELKSITMNINLPSTDFVGLFTNLTGSFSISDLILKGTVKGRNNVGVLSGKTSTDEQSVSSDAKIINVINEADVTANTYAAGFIGRAYDNGSGNLTVERLVNKGEIKANGNYAGGIFGLSTTIKNSYLANTASVTASSYAGGIGAWSYTSFNQCYNTGDITSNGYSGGIYGEQKGSSVTNSFNYGKISGSSTGSISGIITTDNALIKNCYTTENTDGNNGFVGKPKTGGNLVFENCYYRSEELGDDSTEGTIPLTLSDMKQLSSFSLFSDTVWEINQDSQYPLPSLISFPVIFKQKQLSKATVNTVEYDDSTKKLTVNLNGSDNAVGYKVEIPEADISEIFTELTDTLDVSSLTYNEIYMIKVTALGDEKIYTNAEPSSYNYEHRKSKLPTPVFSITEAEWSNTYGDEAYLVSWSEVNNAVGYEIYLSDGTNNITAQTTTNSYILDETVATLGNVYNLYVKALSEDGYSDSEKSTPFVIDTRFAGTAEVDSEDYSLIGVSRHLSYIADNLSGNYLVIADFEDYDYLYDQISDNAFSGKLIGYDLEADEKTKRNIYVEIADNGLFAKAASDFYISHIILNGSITSSVKNTGGFIGEIVSGGTGSGIFHCVNNASVTGTVASNVCQTYGGFIGYGYKTGYAIENCINNGAITSGGTEVGGIVGIAAKISIKNCANTGEIKAKHTGVPNAGGIVGHNYAIIENCYNTGNITIKDSAGGIAGTNKSGSEIKNCFNLGNVKATNGVSGGIVGKINGNSNVECCYNRGTVTGTTTGGVYGSEISGYTVALLNNYYLAGETNQAIGAISSDDMMNLNNFSGFSSNIWIIDTENTTYPYPNIKTNLYKKKAGI